MGLFSSKYKTTVGTAVARVIEDKGLGDAVQSGTIRALFGDGDLVDEILEEMNACIGVRAERAYSYAEAHYTHGMPASQLKSTALGRAQVQAVLQAVEGAPVLMEYCHIAPPNLLHIGWMKLVSQYGYSTTNNTISGLPKATETTVWLDDMRVVVSQAAASTLEPSSLGLWGVAAKAGYTPARPLGTPTTRAMVAPTDVEVRGGTEHVLVTWCFNEGTPAVLQKFDLTIPVTGYVDTATYAQVRYTVGGVAKYWMYRLGAGTYPTLDALVNTAAPVGGTFFPFLYFRYNKQSEISNKTTDAYKTSKKLAKHFGLDYDRVAEAIDANPDITDVEQAMMVMAVPANTTDPIERQYLFEFFDGLFFDSDGKRFPTPEQAATYYRLYGEAAPQNGLVIQDTRFKMSLNYEGLYKQIVAGSVGAIGVYDSGFTKYNDTVLVWNADAGVFEEVTVERDRHYFRHQITEATYEEVQVLNLQTKFFVFGDYAATGDDESSILLVPLDRALTKRYPIPIREKLYGRSLHYVFNSRVVTKIKWYQQSFFKAIMMIVAVVIAVYSAGAMASLLNAAYIMGGSALVATTIALGIFEAVLVTVGAKLFIKAAGLEATLWAALIIAAVGLYMGYSAGGVPGAPWASNLLEFSSNLVKAVTQSLQDAMNALASDASEFSKYIKDQTKLLDSANDLLETTGVLTPRIVFGESPDDFYNRTVRSGNIGLIGIGAISSYVDIALTLPEIDDTLGGNFNVL